ncbi:MAG: hypothetical protein M5U01_22080 [Ardenticatenaceae bacterium]|nr:hypothetical protein [Ardenticatenaceae bacterium]HBY96286.1 hypothetical protein [Chloroflexota bacterium]
MRTAGIPATAILLLAAVVTVATLLLQPPVLQANPSHHLKYEVKGANARLIREVTGAVVADVEGVPAQPVHAFVWWGGEGVVRIEGSIKIEVDPVSNSGEIKAEWVDRYGHWKLTQTLFASPDHPTGLRIGSSASTTELVVDDPITTNVYLHGDTTAGEPVLPTLFNLLATWGPATVTLNGQPFENPFDGPTPMWLTHVMVSVGTRHPNGTVTANNGTEIYSPALQSAGDTQPDDREVHLVFHDAPGPTLVEGNFPPPFSFFYHVLFEDVDVEIHHSE